MRRARFPHAPRAETGVLTGLPPAAADPASGVPAPVQTRPVYVDAATGVIEAPIYRGGDLAAGHVIDGPLVVEDTTTTGFVGRGDRLEIDAGGTYLLHIEAKGGSDGS